MHRGTHHSKAEDVWFGGNLTPEGLWCHVRCTTHNPLCHHRGWRPRRRSPCQAKVWDLRHQFIIQQNICTGNKTHFWVKHNQVKYDYVLATCKLIVFNVVDIIDQMWKICRDILPFDIPVNMVVSVQVIQPPGCSYSYQTPPVPGERGGPVLQRHPNTHTDVRSQVAERLRNRASNQKVACSILAVQHYIVSLGKALASGGVSLYLL